MCTIVAVKRQSSIIIIIIIIVIISTSFEYSTTILVRIYWPCLLLREMLNCEKTPPHLAIYQSSFSFRRTKFDIKWISFEDDVVCTVSPLDDSPTLIGKKKISLHRERHNQFQLINYVIRVDRCNPESSIICQWRLDYTISRVRRADNQQQLIHDVSLLFFFNLISARYLATSIPDT